MNKNTILYTLIAIVAISCIFDIATFLYFIFNNASNGVSFEINPIVLLIKSYVGSTIAIIIALIFKLLINVGIIWLLLTYKPSKSHLGAFFVALMSLIGIIIQCYGGYSNLHINNLIETSEPGAIIPPTSTQSASLWSLTFILYAFFILFEFVAFWIYERLYRM